MLKMYLDMFSRVLPFVKQYDVIIATETFGDTLGSARIDFFGDITRFIKGFDAVLEANPEYTDYFKVCVDTGHSHGSILNAQSGE